MDEPRTPAWLPILGIGLFLLLVVWLLAGRRGRVDATVTAPVPAAVAEH